VSCEAQADAAGLPLHVVPVPGRGTKSMSSDALSPALLPTASPTAFGDLFLEDAAVGKIDSASGPNPCSRSGRPVNRDLGGHDRRLQARLTCIDPRKLGRHFAGRLGEVVERDGFVFADLSHETTPDVSQAHRLPD
jgi:hypothetical protein